MDHLPIEIIEKILSDSALSIHDVLAVSVASKRMKRIVENSNCVWKAVYHNSMPQHEGCILNGWHWLDETKYMFATRSKIRKMLLAMARKFYAISELSASDFVEWIDFIDERSSTYSIVVDYLITLVDTKSFPSEFENVPFSIPVNLTMQFYARKCVRFLKQFKLKQEYEEFIQLGESEKILEKAAVFVAQWCQPTSQIFYNDIRNQLDYIAKQVENELKIKYPSHPYFDVPLEVRKTWYTRNLSQNQYDAKRSMQVLEVIAEIMFNSMEFFGNRFDYYHISNSFINRVLEEKKGLPITLSVIYESVARRMGLNCEPMNVPAHFLLRLIFRDDLRSALFIDSFHGGHLYPLSVSPQLRLKSKYLSSQRATAESVMLRMAGNLEAAMKESHHTRAHLTQLRSVLELMVLIAPQDLNAVVKLSRLCMSFNMNTTFIEEIIERTAYDSQQHPEHVLQMLREYSAHNRRMHDQQVDQKPKSKTRPARIQFAVGMLIRHKIFNHNGVIADWSPVCEASETWQCSMRVDSLKRKANQPFYYCIFEDGTNRYVPEENIQIAFYCRSLLENEEIGYHFSHFNVNHFVPNEEKAREYPEDAIVRQKIYHC